MPTPVKMTHLPVEHAPALQKLYPAGIPSVSGLKILVRFAGPSIARRRLLKDLAAARYLTALARAASQTGSLKR